MISNARRILSAPIAALLLAAPLALAGCASTFDVLPQKMGGLSADAPERAAESKPFPNVYEVRPTREAVPLTTEEQKKLETDLTNLREQQKQLANPPPPPEPKKAAASAKKPSAKVAQPAKKEKKQKDPVVPEQKGPVAAPKMVN
jgi:hypothetical protein